MTGSLVSRLNLRSVRLRKLLRDTGFSQYVDRFGLENLVRAIGDTHPAQLRPFLGDLVLHPILRHRYPKTVPYLETGIVPQLDKIARRVQRAYSRARALSHGEVSEGVWSAIARIYQGPLLQCLENENSHELVELIPTLLRSRCVYGFGAGQEDYEALLHAHRAERHGTLFVDALVSLAEAWGVLTVECPEQGKWGENLYADQVELAQRCERALGCALDTPPVCGAVGVSVAGRLWMPRTPHYAYAVRRCIELARDSDHVRIAEIGAGYGGTALIAARLGLNYSCFDLPIIGAIQAIFLLSALGMDCIRLCGEEQSTSHMIHLMPYWDFFQSDEQFAVILNQDSLPEIPPETAHRYARTMERRARRFLSINQEAEEDAWGTGSTQLVVSHVFEKESTMVRTARYPYWLRRGYVEEVFEQRA